MVSVDSVSGSGNSLSNIVQVLRSHRTRIAISGDSDGRKNTSIPRGT